jgi:hypothetical protein
MSRSNAVLVSESPESSFVESQTSLQQIRHGIDNLQQLQRHVMLHGTGCKSGNSDQKQKGSLIEHGG